MVNWKHRSKYTESDFSAQRGAERSPLMPRTKTLGRPPGANSEETRRRILDVARNHIGARGYAKATLKEISSEAGLTSGAIYYYFQSKQELVNALIAETHDAIEGRFRAAAQ